MKAREQALRIDPQLQASAYVARLYSGDMTQQDEAEFFAWLKSDPAHRRAYDEVTALWDVAGELRDDLDVLAAGRARAGSREVWRARTRSIAAAALLFLITGSILLTSYLDPSGGGQALASYETAIGEQGVFALEDGSRVTLNTGSRVLADYTPHERRLILDFGEAFFEIEEDLQRPLTVSAGGRFVVALGTKFGILLAGRELRVSVVEGAVAVREEEIRFPRSQLSAPPAREDSLAAFALTPARLSRLLGPNDVVLQAGTIATFSDEDEEITANDAESIERLQSWRTGVVRFEGEPLYRVVSELNRYSKAKILIEDDAIMNLPISGVFRLESVDLIMEALEEVIPIEIINYPDRYVLVASDRADRSPARPGSQ